MILSSVFLLAAICQVNCQWNMFGWNNKPQQHQHGNNPYYDKNFGSEVSSDGQDGADYAGWYSNFNKDLGQVDLDADKVFDLMGQHQQSSCHRHPQFQGQQAQYSHLLRRWCYPGAPAVTTPAPKRNLCATLSVYNGALQANNMHQCQAFPSYGGDNPGYLVLDVFSVPMSFSFQRLLSSRGFVSLCLEML